MRRGPYRLRFVVGPLGFDYDDDYGTAHRSGWSTHWRGSYLAELTTPWSCLRALVRHLARRRD